MSAATKRGTQDGGSRRVSATYLHQTDAGFAVQINDQTLCWLGKEDVPLWSIRAKPYIYRVHCCPSTDVFVGTDGRGGCLRAFDPTSGEETLNVKPPLGGAGTLAKIPAHQMLVAKFWTSRETLYPATCSFYRCGTDVIEWIANVESW